MTNAVAISSSCTVYDGAGFDLSNNILVTDRGDGSLVNVQKMTNMKLAFVQGVRRSENVIDGMFTKHKQQLLSGAFYNGYLKASAFTYQEPWQHDTFVQTLEQMIVRNPSWRIPNNSLDCMLKTMDLIKADKRKNANAWVTRTPG